MEEGPFDQPSYPNIDSSLLRAKTKPVVHYPFGSSISAFALAASAEFGSAAITLFMYLDGAGGVGLLQARRANLEQRLRPVSVHLDGAR